MISQIIAEVELNISSILNNFKSLLKKYIKKNGRKILKRKRIKIITSEEKESKKSNNYLDLKKKKTIDF